MSAHPDAELLRLGSVFDKATAAARKADHRRSRLFAAYERVADDRAIPSDDFPARRKVMVEVGYINAARAAEGPATEAIKHMRAIHRLQPSTLEGVAVKLRALCFDFADFHCENVDLRKGDVAEVELGRLMRHVNKIVQGGRP